MLIICIILTFSYILYLIYEKKANDKYLSSFKYVIHVNGIRGKTSVARLIDANLRGAGYRVFTKTTGSTPFYIDTNGNEILIRRMGSSNIKEQLKIIKLAYRQHAEVLILECMAVNPELQKVSQNYIVKSNIGIITNVRYDHIFEMGESLDEIAASLSNTIPYNGVLFTADNEYFEYFSDICKQRNTQIILCEGDDTIPSENHAIAFEVGKYLGISKKDFINSIIDYKEDFGCTKMYQISDRLQLLNLFSVNDPISTINMIKKYIPQTDNAVLIYNNRIDRPDRLVLFIKYFFNSVNYKRIVIIGENKTFAFRLLKKNNIKNVSIMNSWRDILQISDTNILIGIGNIKGCSYELLNYLEEVSCK